jgi:hypothetical protein
MHLLPVLPEHCPQALEEDLPHLRRISTPLGLHDSTTPPVMVDADWFEPSPGWKAWATIGNESGQAPATSFAPATVARLHQAGYSVWQHWTRLNVRAAFTPPETSRLRRFLLPSWDAVGPDAAQPAWTRTISSWDPGPRERSTRPVTGTSPGTLASFPKCDRQLCLVGR